MLRLKIDDVFIGVYDYRFDRHGRGDGQKHKGVKPYTTGSV